MGKYIFETHYGKSSVTDTETGVIVEWENGRFNETNAGRLDPTSKLNLCTNAGEVAETLARAFKEIGDYVTSNHPETI
jgi:hypothetical protein